MTKALSLDIRRRIVRFVASGHSRREGAAHFEVAPSCAIKLVAAYAQTGSYAPQPEGGWRYSKLDPHRAFLERRIADKPDITMSELAAEIAPLDVKIAPASLSRWFIRHGYRFKRTLPASEQEHQDVKAAREAWRGRQPWMGRERHRLVFVDETGTTTKMTRLRGRCLKGQRLRAKAPFGHWKTQTFIAGLRDRRLTAPFVVDQPMNRRIFDTWVQTQLAPTLAKGDVVILDNLAAHKSPNAEAAMRAQGAWMLFLPPYSPDLNPHQDGLLQAQIPPSGQSHPHYRRTLESHRRHLRTLHPHRMQQLLQGRRI